MYESSQGETLAWLARVHTEAERVASAARVPDELDAERFGQEMERLVRRFGCSPQSIARRGYEIPDVARSRWDEMLVYDFALGPEGAGTRARTRHFARVTERVLEALYDDDDPSLVPPRDLLHVTCTGYASPSAAQRLVARRGWGRATRVLHAYHMGCYAALPAVRMAAALVGGGGSERVDVVHTEIARSTSVRSSTRPSSSWSRASSPTGTSDTRSFRLRAVRIHRSRCSECARSCSPTPPTR